MTPCTVCDQATLLVAKMRIATQKTTKVRTRTLHPQFFKKLFVHGTTRASRSSLHEGSRYHHKIAHPKHWRTGPLRGIEVPHRVFVKDKFRFPGTKLYINRIQFNATLTRRS